MLHASRGQCIMHHVDHASCILRDYHGPQDLMAAAGRRNVMLDTKAADIYGGRILRNLIALAEPTCSHSESGSGSDSGSESRSESERGGDSVGDSAAVVGRSGADVSVGSVCAYISRKTDLEESAPLATCTVPPRL